MKIRIYPKDIGKKSLDEMTYIGHDSNGGFYMIDVAHLSPHEEVSREAINSITWNNVDLMKEKEIKKKNCDSNFHDEGIREQYSPTERCTVCGEL